MSDNLDGHEVYTQKYQEIDETIDCPICKKGKIEIKRIPGWYEWKVSRISAGAKRTKFFHDPKFKVMNKCPECGASRETIKEALEKGKKPETKDERKKRLEAAGIPTQIEM
ncbi:MAG: hypothetical protein GXO64_02440 [Candidatus Micrarchaeota archaeon]|nr:hypothetical protein [Candidatus Micrarchaeota archaeon]